MGINFMRVLAGGVVAGIVFDLYEAVMNGMIMAPQWAAIMTSLNRPHYTSSQVMLFQAVGIVTGLAAVWTYAAIRPRFGHGPRTALIAAALTWLTAKAVVLAYPLISGIYPLQPMMVMLIAQIPEIALGTLAGAWVYREADRSVLVAA
jgi:hypothetical protein